MSVISKVEWESIKARAGNRCRMCGIKDTNGNLLERAHLKAKSKGGTQIIPLCPNCHTKYDKRLCTVEDLEKIGVKPEDYKKLLPKKPGPKASKSSSPSEFDKLFGLAGEKKSKSKSSSSSDFDKLFGLTGEKKSKSKSSSSSDFDKLFGVTSEKKSKSKSSSSSDFDKLFGVTDKKKSKSKSKSKSSSSSSFDDLFRI